jgi:hypothetical protein
MPILDVDKARTVMVIKRGMGAGFVGIENPLYFLDRTLMLFGDAKGFVGNIVRELNGGGGHGRVKTSLSFSPELSAFRPFESQLSTFLFNKLALF